MCRETTGQGCRRSVCGRPGGDALAAPAPPAHGPSPWNHCSPGVGHKIIGWDLDGFALHDVFQSPVHQIVIKSICGGQNKRQDYLSRCPCAGDGATSSASGSASHDPQEHFGLGAAPADYVYGAAAQVPCPTQKSAPSDFLSGQPREVGGLEIYFYFSFF